MDHIVKELLAKALTAKTMAQTKTFIEAAIMVYEEHDKVSFILKSIVDGKKISVIKELRELYNWGLAEAKEFTETPNALFPLIGKSKAGILKSRLTNAGAIIEEK